MLYTCPTRPEGKKNKWWVFLAGPIQGAPEWQFSVDTNLDGIDFLSPRRITTEGFDYDEQVQWETDMLTAADIVLFWIPNEEEHIEGRNYAQTTRTEFGEYLARGKKIFIGIEDKKFPGYRYFQTKLDQYDMGTIYSSFEDVMKAVQDYINERDAATANPEEGIFFTSDTHFTSDRTWELSKRPFINPAAMDRAMIERWNAKVPPFATVYHIGDMGNPEIVKYLNGDIIFINGNYETEPGRITDEEQAGIDSYVNQRYSSFTLKVKNAKGDIMKYYMAHKPLDVKARWEEDPEHTMGVFGHIHGRQMIKEFGVDCGVDCHNYTPMSLKDVQFFENALRKGYYDEEVWS